MNMAKTERITYVAETLVDQLDVPEQMVMLCCVVDRVAAHANIGSIELLQMLTPTIEDVNLKYGRVQL